MPSPQNLIDVMEKLDYEKLIDPLCIPVIKILREDLGVETLFCCQGKSVDDPENSSHSISGYIACKKTPRNRDIIRKIPRLLRQKIDYPVCNTETTPWFYTLRLRKLQNPGRVWKKIEEVLIENNFDV